MEETLMRMLDLIEMTSPEVFGWLVEQVIIKGWIMSTFGIVLATTSAAFAIWATWKWRTSKEYDPAPYIVTIIYGTVAFMLFILLLTDGVYHIYTPEAHALRSLL